MSLDAVAKRAGVSTATVSRVLNKFGAVKTSTRTRVLKAIEELNYHPNLNARNLAGGRNQTIGMIASNLENPFFFDIFKSLEAQALARGYEVVVANTDYRTGHLASSVRLMIGRRVAGLALIVSEMDADLLDDLAHSKTPVVLYDVGTPGPNVASIRVNYGRSIQKIVEYLYNGGHRKMSFVGHHAALGPTGAREKAFTEATSKYGDQLETRIATDNDALEGGRQAARQLLSDGFKPTAIVCVNDFMATGVLRELRDRGLRVPEDVSVTGYDNIKLSEFCSPPLTTVHIPRDRIGQIAFECLVPEHGRASAVGREIVIDPEFLIRDSTGPARKP